KKMTISTDDYSKKGIIIKEVVEKMKQLEPHVEVKDLSTMERISKNTRIILELEGLDCAGCADNIVEYTKTIKGVKEVDLNFVNKKMNIELEDIRLKNEVIDLVTEKMKQLEPHVVVNDVTSGKVKKESKKEETKLLSQNKDLLRIIIAGIFFAMPYVLKLEGTARFISFLISYVIVGTDVILTAFRNIKAGNAMDEHFLMTVATIGAFIIGEYPEGVAVMLFYQLGEYFQGKAVNHSRSSIKALMDIRPDYANLLVDGDVIVVAPEDIEIGDYILIRPGEKVPLDGIVVEGSSTLDTSNITGESVPRRIKEGEDLVSGVVNNQGVLKVKVTKEFGDSTIVKILDLVENASSRKAPTENFITKFSRYYTPIVVYAALAIGVIPPLLFGGQWADWAYKAFVFLVISCPCALVISIPLGFFGGIGAASKEGILIKGGNYLEALNDIDTVVFDKTGTITKGVFKVTDIKSYSDYSKEDILEIAAYGEVYSNHPIGVSIISSYDKEIDKTRIQEYEEIAGNGIKAKMGDRYFYLGNKSLLEDRKITVNEEDSIGTVVYVAEDNKHVGTIIVSDELKDNIKQSLEELNSVGVKNTIMLSGDNKETVDKVAKASGINIAYGELLPQDKVAKFEEILKNKDPKHKVAFVGDGVNDAPVLARADIGIAMGGLGSDAAIEASDIVIMTDEIHKISTGIKIANKTKRIVTQNIILALGVKFIVLALGVFGKASMWQAVFADVGVSIIAIFNSIRALKVDK
ncbi:MAG TPA: heavy metal translocating P-type ATPase, partial [Tissierellaceae bacterium]